MVLARLRDYGAQLLALLPTGPAWTKEPGSNMHGLLHGIGDILADVDARAGELLRELDPRTASESLLEWERVLGLPDVCTDVPVTLDERRNAIVQKLTGLGSSTPAGMVEMAAMLGYSITIEEHLHVESRCGHITCGATIGGGQWGHAFTVHAPVSSFTSIFKSGSGHSGDPIRTWGNNILECAVLRAKPAHTDVIFAYDL